MLVSAVVITKNESAHIKRCLDALGWCDEIIVIDDFSEDGTQSIAEALGAKVIEFSGGYAAAKNLGIDRASGKWVLSIDADETVTSDLAIEIKGVLEADEQQDGYYVPRRNHLAGRWIRHAGYYPDLQLRLFKQEIGRFSSVAVHERVNLPLENTGILEHPLIHATYSSYKDYYAKVQKYAELDAHQALAEDATTSLLHLVFSPGKQFFRSLISQSGWREGRLGLCLAYGMGLYAFIKHREMGRISRQDRSAP